MSLKIKEYNNFKLMDMYSDYGDVTGMQTLRRFIEHCNDYFIDMNETMQEFIDLYTDLQEIKNDFDAFQEAWETMQKENAEFIDEVKKQLDEWIENPEVQSWLVEKLDEVVAEALLSKVDKTDFNAFKGEYATDKATQKTKNEKYDGIIVDFGDFKLEFETYKTDTQNNIDEKLDMVTFNEFKEELLKEMMSKDAVLNIAHPIGSIFTTVENKNPALIFGGVWERFASGKTLVGYDGSQIEFNEVEKTGGEKEVTLTEQQIPPHKHGITVNVGFGSGGSYLGTNGNSANERASQSIGLTGGGEAHNNLSPYIVVYFWKRIG